MLSTLILSLAALQPVLAASSTTMSLFLLDTDPQSLVGSVVGVSAARTTYAVSCAPGTDAMDCGMPVPMTVVEGDGYFAEMLTMSDGSLAMTAQCSLDMDGATATAAFCTESISGSAANFPGVTSASLPPEDITYYPVVITAGAELLKDSPASASASATATPKAGASASASASGFATATASAAKNLTAAASNSTAANATASGVSKSSSGASGNMASSMGLVVVLAVSIGVAIL